MLFVCYPKCSTCQKAKTWLQERGVAFDERDIKQDNPTEQELRAWHEKSGLPLKRFFNTSGLQYKALGLKDKLPAMTEDEQYALLATDGMLVKRPLLIGEDFALPGFKVKEWEERLEQPFFFGNVNSKCEKNIKKYNQASRANSSRHSANTISEVFQPNISRG